MYAYNYIYNIIYYIKKIISSTELKIIPKNYLKMFVNSSAAVWRMNNFFL